MTIATNKYKFYMQEISNGLLVPTTRKDLEHDFEGLRYISAKGINSIGKARIFTETYADSDRVRAYVPETITNESTTVTFTFYFFGENRQKTYDEFNEYIRHGVHRYWDTARNKYFEFVMENSIEVKEEKWYLGTPYLSVEYKVKNLNGKTFDVDFE